MEHGAVGERGAQPRLRGPQPPIQRRGNDHLSDRGARTPSRHPASHMGGAVKICTLCVPRTAAHIDVVRPCPDQRTEQAAAHFNTPHSVRGHRDGGQPRSAGSPPCRQRSGPTRETDPEPTAGREQEAGGVGSPGQLIHRCVERAAQRVDLCVPRTPSPSLISTFPEGDLDITPRREPA